MLAQRLSNVYKPLYPKIYMVEPLSSSYITVHVSIGLGHTGKLYLEYRYICIWLQVKLIWRFSMCLYAYSRYTIKINMNNYYLFIISLD